MNGKTTRIFKEARPLFWPWCAVVCAGALPLFHRFHSNPPVGTIEWINVAGFFLGIPLLAALPFGNEFQNRTLYLLLSQPVSRSRMFVEKLGTQLLVVLSAGLVFFASDAAGGVRQQDPYSLLFYVSWILAILGSSTFWTLFTRSTLGGVALITVLQIVVVFLPNFAHRLILQIVVVFLPNFARWLIWKVPQMPGDYGNLSMPILFLLIYAGVMFWLGWRKLARFQATGGMAGDDLLTAGPQVLPGALVSWLRCRPRGAVLNLFRKEFRLLRPVWLISLLAAVGWACLTLLGLLHPQGLTRNFETAVVSAGVITTLIVAVLAGSLSLGEEKTSGTHLWQLSLPVPARRQWFVKLCMALFAGFVGAGVVPLLIAGRLLGSSHMLADVHVGRDLLVGAVLLTFAAFWCACAVKGTVPAVLWALPVMIALYFPVELGKWAGRGLTNLFLSRFDPFANVKFAAAVSHLRSNAFFKLIEAASTNMTDSAQAALVLTTLILVPTMLCAVIQSYRLFRAQLQDRALSVLRSLLPLATLASLCGFSSLASYTFVGRAAWATLDPRWTGLTETIEALRKIQSGVAKPDASHPLELNVEDLAKAFPLSKSTRRLLGDSHITLSLDAPPHHGYFGCAENPLPFGRFVRRDSWYSAIIRLDGSSFAVAFDPANHNPVSVGFCAGQPPPPPEGGVVRVP
jgi:hypothetical protein